jgi:hypothetical protein
VRQVVESRSLVSFVVSTALGLYLFRGWPFPAENNMLHMVMLQKPYLYYGMKYGFVAMLFTTAYITFSILFSLLFRASQCSPGVDRCGGTGSSQTAWIAFWTA